MNTTKTAVLATCTLLLLACEPPPGGGEREPEPTQLTSQPAVCDRPQAPVRRAREALATGSARAARYPFVAREGQRALELLEMARACFELAQRSADALDAARQRDQLLERMQRDYRTLRIRLSRARAAGRNGQALRASRELLAVLHGTRDPYVDHLRALEHRLSHRGSLQEAP